MVGQGGLPNGIILTIDIANSTRTGFLSMYIIDFLGFPICIENPHQIMKLVVLKKPIQYVCTVITDKFPRQDVQESSWLHQYQNLMANQ